MAAEGFKPGDFYIGVYEFFAVLLPGTILTYLVWSLDLQCLIKDSSPPFNSLAPGEGAASYLTFAVLSYVVGHFLAALGWVFVDTVFEAQRESEDLFRVPLQLGREARARIVKGYPNITEITDLFSWALAYIDIHHPAAAGKLELIEADCKFFRNLIPALLLSLPIIDVHRFRWFYGTVLETCWILCFFAYIAVASFQFRRHRDRQPRMCRGITSLPWLLGLLIVPISISIVLAWCRFGPQRYFWIDFGILLAILLAIGRYLLLQVKRMVTAYEYLLADPGLVSKGA